MCPKPLMELLEKFYIKNKPEFLILGISQMKNILHCLKTNKVNSDNL